MPDIIGWDIGGVHLKAARVRLDGGRPTVSAARARYFEMWREHARLPEALRDLRRELGGGEAAHALTMTAELADCFAGRAEGVRWVVSAAHEALGGEALCVWSVEGRFAPADAALERPLEFAASNWLATAAVVARGVPEGLLVDVGSTTTDLVPISGGRPAPAARDDTGRLIAGEMVYTGILRTPPAALAPDVPLRGTWCRLSPEPFAFTADVYLALGRIRPDQVTVPTADGRPATPAAARSRLARLLCADAVSLGPGAILGVARFLESAQLASLERAARQVLSRLEGGGAADDRAGQWSDGAEREGGGAEEPALRSALVATGAGKFLVQPLGARLGLPVRDLSEIVPVEDPQAAPAACVALLLAGEMEDVR